MSQSASPFHPFIFSPSCSADLLESENIHHDHEEKLAVIVNSDDGGQTVQNIDWIGLINLWVEVQISRSTYYTTSPKWVPDRPIRGCRRLDRKREQARTQMSAKLCSIPLILPYYPSRLVKPKILHRLSAISAWSRNISHLYLRISFLDIGLNLPNRLPSSSSDQIPHRHRTSLASPYFSWPSGRPPETAEIQSDPPSPPSHPVEMVSFVFGFKSTVHRICL